MTRHRGGAALRGRDAVARMRRWLLLAIGATGVLIVVLWLFGGPDRELRQAHLGLPALPSAAALAGGGADIRPALERPLFWAGRRPLEPTSSAVVATSAVTQQEELSFVGVVAWRGGSRALIATPTGTVRAGRGEKVGGWTVLSVSRNRVVLRDGASTLELRPSPTASDAIRLRRAHP